MRAFKSFRMFWSVILVFLLAFSPTIGYAQSVFISTLPDPGVMVSQSAAFVPVLAKGLVVHPDKPLNFDFIIDSGNDSAESSVIKEQSARIAKYFLAAVTVPEDQLWVNLSPYEKDHIIENDLGQTVLGRDMLAQDYVLKQLTASLVYPEKELGKAFWARIYKEAQEKFGTTDIPVDTFNKVWIMPEKAEVFEKGNAVYVTEARLKVMLDSDRTAMAKNLSDKTSDEKAVLTKAVMREVIIPAIEKEVNEGKSFAVIRQVYNAAILAKWYRELIQNTLLADAYIGKNKVAGITADEKAIKEQIYQRYIAAYKKGVFNYIKEDVNTTTGEALPRKYFSGGIRGFAMKGVPLSRRTGTAPVSANHAVGKFLRVEMAMNTVNEGSSARELKEIKGRLGKSFLGVTNYLDPGSRGEGPENYRAFEGVSVDVLAEVIRQNAKSASEIDHLVELVRHSRVEFSRALTNVYIYVTRGSHGDPRMYTTDIDLGTFGMSSQELIGEGTPLESTLSRNVSVERLSDSFWEQFPYTQQLVAELNRLSQSPDEKVRQRAKRDMGLIPGESSAKELDGKTGLTDDMNRGKTERAMNVAGEAALFRLAVSGDAEKIRDLLRDGTVNVNARDRGFTPLIVAAMYGNAKAVETLLAADAGIDLQNNDGGTALLFAVENNKVETTNVLLDHEADTTIQNRHGAWPLILAVFKGYLEVVKSLVAHHVDLDRQTSDGHTPLMYAAKAGRADIVKALLDAEADVNIPAANGLTALDFARHSGNPAVVELVEAAIAKGKTSGKTRRDVQYSLGILQNLLTSVEEFLSLKDGRELVKQTLDKISAIIASQDLEGADSALRLSLGQGYAMIGEYARSVEVIKAVRRATALEEAVIARYEFMDSLAQQWPQARDISDIALHTELMAAHQALNNSMDLEAILDKVEEKVTAQRISGKKTRLLIALGQFNAAVGRQSTGISLVMQAVEIGQTLRKQGKHLEAVRTISAAGVASNKIDPKVPADKYTFLFELGLSIVEEIDENTHYPDELMAMGYLTDFLYRVGMRNKAGSLLHQVGRRNIQKFQNTAMPPDVASAYAFVLTKVSMTGQGQIAKRLSAGHPDNVNQALILAGNGESQEAVDRLVNGFYEIFKVEMKAPGERGPSIVIDMPAAFMQDLLRNAEDIVKLDGGKEALLTAAGKMRNDLEAAKLGVSDYLIRIHLADIFAYLGDYGQALDVVSGIRGEEGRDQAEFKAVRYQFMLAFSLRVPAVRNVFNPALGMSLFESYTRGGSLMDPNAIVSRAVDLGKGRSSTFAGLAGLIGLAELISGMGNSRQGIELIEKDVLPKIQEIGIAKPEVKIFLLSVAGLALARMGAKADLIAAPLNEGYSFALDLFDTNPAQALNAIGALSDAFVASGRKDVAIKLLDAAINKLTRDFPKEIPDRIQYGYGYLIRKLAAAGNVERARALMPKFTQTNVMLSAVLEIASGTPEKATDGLVSVFGENIKALQQLYGNGDGERAMTGYSLRRDTGRWTSEEISFNASAQALILRNATRISQDGVVDGQNKPQDIVLKVRDLNDDERKIVQGFKDQLGFGSGKDIEDIRVFRKDADAVANRMFGVAHDKVLYVREDYIFGKVTKEDMTQIKAERFTEALTRLFVQMAKREEPMAVYNEDGQYVGIKTRGEVYSKPGNWVRIADIIPIGPDGNVVLQRRSKYASTSQGIASVHGGHFDVNQDASGQWVRETPTEAAVRELGEEIGVKNIDPSRLIPVGGEDPQMFKMLGDDAVVKDGIDPQGRYVSNSRITGRVVNRFMSLFMVFLTQAEIEKADRYVRGIDEETRQAVETEAGELVPVDFGRLAEEVKSSTARYTSGIKYYLGWSKSEDLIRGIIDRDIQQKADKFFKDGFTDEDKKKIVEMSEYTFNRLISILEGMGRATPEALKTKEQVEQIRDSWQKIKPVNSWGLSETIFGRTFSRKENQAFSVITVVDADEESMGTWRENRKEKDAFLAEHPGAEEVAVISWGRLRIWSSPDVYEERSSYIVRCDKEGLPHDGAKGAAGSFIRSNFGPPSTIKGTSVVWITETGDPLTHRAVKKETLVDLLVDIASQGKMGDEDIRKMVEAANAKIVIIPGDATFPSIAAGGGVLKYLEGKAADKGLIAIADRIHGLAEWAMGQPGQEGSAGAFDPGGVDIHGIDVAHKNRSAKIRFDDQAVRDVLRNGFDGFTPVIINITPISSSLMMLGEREAEEQIIGG